MKMLETERAIGFDSAVITIPNHHHSLETGAPPTRLAALFAPLAVLLAFGLAPEPTLAGASASDGQNETEKTGTVYATYRVASAAPAGNYEPIRPAPVPAPYDPPEPLPAPIFRHDPGQFMPDPPEPVSAPNP